MVEVGRLNGGIVVGVDREDILEEQETESLRRQQSVKKEAREAREEAKRILRLFIRHVIILVHDGRVLTFNEAPTQKTLKSPACPTNLCDEMLIFESRVEEMAGH